MRRGPGLAALARRATAQAILRDAESATIAADEELLVAELDLLDLTRNEPSCWTRDDVDDWVVPLVLEDSDSEW